MRKVFFIAVLVTLVLPVASGAITRYSRENPFFRRTALSGFAGYGQPVGNFASDRDGDGNHESGALDWSAEIDHFFAPRVAIGVTISNSTWQDKSFPELESHLSSFAGLLRYVIVTRSALHPYLRLAMGGQRVQFQDSQERFRSNSAFMVQAGGGLLLMLFNYVSLNGQVTYTQGFTENTYVRDFDAIVGFDTTYWTFSGGVSVYFP